VHCARLRSSNTTVPSERENWNSVSRGPVPQFSVWLSTWYSTVPPTPIPVSPEVAPVHTRRRVTATLCAPQQLAAHGAAVTTNSMPARVHGFPSAWAHPAITLTHSPGLSSGWSGHPPMTTSKHLWLAPPAVVHDPDGVIILSWFSTVHLHPSWAAEVIAENAIATSKNNVEAVFVMVLDPVEGPCKK